MSGGQAPLSLYLHLPWCVRKCPYCDFNSYTAGKDAPRRRYIEALLVDLVQEAERAEGREIISIYLGGGTPSLFAADEVGLLLDAVAGRFSLATDIEITMEANPGTVECGDPAAYRGAGVNRLSVGAQSFDAASLEVLGRIHGVDDIRRIVDDAQQAGLANINLDVMYALPGQGMTAAMADLESAARLGPAHISWYQLTLEPNTVFHARPPEGLPDENATFAIQVEGQKLLANLGYEQYEVSAYASDGRSSKHNLNYWSFGDYLGVGAGAHGKISRGREIWRYAKPANPQQYMQAAERGALAPELCDVPEKDRLFEFMLNVLRLTSAFDERLFVARTGLSREYLRARLAPAVKKGLIGETRPGFWRATALGGQFLNDLQGEFLPA